MMLFIYFNDSTEKCVNFLLPGSLDSSFHYFWLFLVVFQFIKRSKTISRHVL